MGVGFNSKGGAYVERSTDETFWKDGFSSCPLGSISGPIVSVIAFANDLFTIIEEMTRALLEIDDAQVMRYVQIVRGSRIFDSNMSQRSNISG